MFSCFYDHMDIRQSPQYATYLEHIGWQIKKIGKWNIFIRKIPFYGKFAKLQKITLPIPFQKINEFIKKNKIRQLIIEPDSLYNKTLEAQFFAHGYSVNNSLFLPTKTILIDLTMPKNDIFQSFSEAKKRAIRKAVKNNIIIQESTDIGSFIKLKNKYFPFFGFLLKKDLLTLWQTFSLKNATLLLAYKDYNNYKHYSKPFAGILLLFWDKKAYYWLAASNKLGNTFATPSLLVWEALKLSKKRGYTVFDFEGIYDKRYHKATKNWQGFTRFKQGFGGREITYLGSFTT